MNGNNLSWDEIDQFAAVFFSIWSRGSELQWAEDAWGHLTKCGLTVADTQLERTRAWMCLVTLGKIYHEFCRKAWYEDSDWRTQEFIGELEDIDGVALGLLAAEHEGYGFESVSDDFELYTLAADAVINSLRPTIFECLQKAYGDPVKLYFRMYHTRGGCDDPGDEFLVTREHASAFDYVTSGF